MFLESIQSRSADGSFIAFLLQLEEIKTHESELVACLNAWLQSAWRMILGHVCCAAGAGCRDGAHATPAPEQGRGLWKCPGSLRGLRLSQREALPVQSGTNIHLQWISGLLDRLRRGRPLFAPPWRRISGGRKHNRLYRAKPFLLFQHFFFFVCHSRSAALLLRLLKTHLPTGCPVPKEILLNFHLLVYKLTLGLNSYSIHRRTPVHLVSWLGNEELVAAYILCNIFFNGAII